MRKKIIALLLLSSALLSLCACKKGDGENAAESVYSDPTYFNGTTTVKVSDEAAVAAAKGVGMEALLQRIEEMLGHARHHVVLCLPYSMGGQVDALHSGAKVNSVDYTASGIEIDAVLDDILYGRLREYVTKEI